MLFDSSLMWWNYEKHVIHEILVSKYYNYHSFRVIKVRQYHVNLSMCARPLSTNYIQSKSPEYSHINIIYMGNNPYSLYCKITISVKNITISVKN